MVAEAARKACVMLAVVSAILGPSGLAEAAACSVQRVSRAAMPQMLRLYRLDGASITLAKSVSRRRLPGTGDEASLMNCGDPLYLGVQLDDGLYLIRRSELFRAEAPCDKLAAKQTLGATAGAGRLQRCKP